MNFQHLNPPQPDAQAYGFSGRRMQRMHRLQQSVEDEQPPECRHVLVFGIKELPARVNFLHNSLGKLTKLASADL